MRSSYFADLMTLPFLTGRATFLCDSLLHRLAKRSYTRNRITTTHLLLSQGSQKVGRIVAAAAARHITPLTLELGGKSPVFVDCSREGANFEIVAKRVLWGKTVNAGQVNQYQTHCCAWAKLTPIIQTCVSPDYLLVRRDRQDELIDEFKKAYMSFWPEGPRFSNSYSRIISEAQVDRIKNMLNDTNGTIVIGGETDRNARYIAPTIVKDVCGDDSLMRE